jgi:hypothetical protein
VPKIKEFLGEKSVDFSLSGLDKTKYKLINNIMLQVGNKTTQVEHVIVANYGIMLLKLKITRAGLLVMDLMIIVSKQLINEKKSFIIQYNRIMDIYNH